MTKCDDHRRAIRKAALGALQMTLLCVPMVLVILWALLPAAGIGDSGWK